MHQDGEFLRLDDFNKSIAIYAHAIAELACLARKK
jgi:acetylornithine deacetylase/succinyl-diaminopimelate desuccinylase-like protein